MAVVTIAVGTTAGWFFTNETWTVLTHPFDRPSEAPPATFFPQLKLALIFGLVLTSPIWLHQVLKMAPRGNGRHPVRLGTAVLLFGVGCALAYLSLRERVWLSTSHGPIVLITDSEYLDQALARILIFSLLAITPLLAIAIRRQPRRRNQSI